jgi:hypothetical protein
MRKRFLLSSLVIGVGLTSPAAALAGPGGSNLPLMGNSTAVLTVSLADGSLTGAASGHLTLLGAFTTIDNTTFTPTGPPGPVIPFEITGTTAFVAANGDELLGTVNGTGDIADSVARGTNVVTITGGTGRFANASGSLTETFTYPFVFVGSSVTGTSTATIQGNINLGSPPAAALDRPTRTAQRKHHTHHFRNRSRRHRA